jgi:hypothetical protein
MPDVAANDQGLIEENIFGLLRSDLMPFPILLSVRIVPVEAGTAVQRVSPFRHNHEYTMDVYTLAASPLASPRVPARHAEASAAGATMIS